MLAIGLPEAAVAELIHPYNGCVDIAAVNSLSALTIAGESGALEQIAATLEERNIFHRCLRVEVAYHSSQMDAVREPLLNALAAIQPRDTRIPFYSSVTGARRPGSDLNAEYWWQNVRKPVRFAQAISALVEDQHYVFVEVGPHPVLQNAIQETVRSGHSTAEVVASLHRGRPERGTMLSALGALYTLGFSPNWRAFTPPEGKYVKLPTYPWQREYYWQESAISKIDRVGQSGPVFLTTPLHLPAPAWEVELNSNFFPYLADHCLDQTIIFPGAGYVEAGLAVHGALHPQETYTLENVEFQKLLVVDSKDTTIMHVRCDPNTHEYKVFSRAKNEDAAWELHATGRLLPGATRPRRRVDVADLRAHCPEEINASGFYDRLALSRFHYGPYFRVLNRIWIGPEAGFAEIRGHPDLANDLAPYTVHPTLLDGAFQLITLNAPLRASRPWVPRSIDRVVVYGSPASSCSAYAEVVERGQGTLHGNIVLCDDQDNVIVEITGIHCQEIATLPAQEAWQQSLYNWVWHPAAEEPALGEAVQSGGVLLMGGPCDGLDSIASTLAAQQVPYVVGERPPSQEFRTILYLSTDSEPEDASAEDFDRAARECTEVLDLLHALPPEMLDVGLALNIVTRGTQAVRPDDRVTGRAGNSLWGLGRVIRAEYPTIACRLIDLGSTPATTDYVRVVEHALQQTTEPEIAVRGGITFVHRLQHAPCSVESGESRSITTDEPVELVIGTPGRLDSLHYQMSVRRAPGPGEVEIRVQASALNYKDILKAMGTISNKVLEGTYFGSAFGMELSGIVVAVGEGVDKLHAGDEVIATTNQGSFRSYVTTPATYVIPKPASLGMQEAPAFTVFMTAYYALVEIARLQPGERVLIHNAAGGVGLAAVQIAQWLGATIFATAGSEEKRADLRAMGIPYVMDSRSLLFADEIRALTAGEGVDVVLNATAGEALRKSFALLAPYGRFVEIGKKDIAENSGLPMQTFNRNVSFTAVDLDRIFRDRVSLAQRLFREVAEGFERDHFRALPTTVFPAAEAETAFRYMAQSKHTGKVMIDFSPQPVAAFPIAAACSPIRHDATYVVTGGTRGFGLEIAKWLVDEGARHLVLISRSGAAGDDLKQAQMMMQGQGVQVMVEAVDVGDFAQVCRLWQSIHAVMPPVRGVIHGAMVLDDVLLTSLTADRLRHVMAPKILGALYLHQVTREAPLDFFVMLSSVASLVGNVGQANYAAANAFLDGFAAYRRACGLPAVTINWGALAEVGVVARNSQVQQLLANAGVQAMHVDHALQNLGRVLQFNLPQIGVLQVDWKKWQTVHAGGCGAALFETLLAEHAAGPDGGTLDPRQQLLHQLALLEPRERMDWMEHLLAEELARILQIPPAQIDYQQNIMHLGIDSLMAVELQTALQSKFALQVSAMEFIRGLSIAQLASRLLSSMVADIEVLAARSVVPDEALDSLLEAEIAHLSDAALDQLVKQAEAGKA